MKSLRVSNKFEVIEKKKLNFEPRKHRFLHIMVVMKEKLGLYVESGSRVLEIQVEKKLYFKNTKKQRN